MNKTVRAQWLEAIGFFCLLWAAFGYFSQGGAANQNSRFALTRAIVELGTLRIDAFASTTFDIATFQGHHYSDKAPGLALVAVPAHALYVAVCGVPTTVQAVRSALHWTTFMSVSLASALAGSMAHILLRHRGYSRAVATLVVCGWLLATPAFAYSTLFYGHQLAAAIVVACLCLIELVDPAKYRWTRALGLGGLLGLLIATEFPTLVLVPVIVGHARPFKHRTMLIGCAVGIGVAVIGIGIFHTFCFGSPIGAGYLSLKSPEFARTMASGWLGFRLPKPQSVVALLIGEARGLLPTAPWLALSLLGAVQLWRRGRRAEVTVAGVGFLVPLLLVAGFARWDGGAALGPRHLVYVLPLLAMLVAEPISRIDALASVPKLLSAVAAGSLLCAGLITCLAAVSVMPELPEGPAWVIVEGERYQADPAHPLTQFVIPLFLEGLLSVKALDSNGRFGLDYVSPGHADDAYNLGEYWFGLRGLKSLLPLGGLWLLGGLVVIVAGRLMPARTAVGQAR